MQEAGLWKAERPRTVKSNRSVLQLGVLIHPGGCRPPVGNFIRSNQTLPLEFPRLKECPGISVLQQNAHCLFSLDTGAMFTTLVVTHNQDAREKKQTHTNLGPNYTHTIPPIPHRKVGLAVPWIVASHRAKSFGPLATKPVYVMSPALDILNVEEAVRLFLCSSKFREQWPQWSYVRCIWDELFAPEMIKCSSQKPGIP